MMQAHRTTFMLQWWTLQIDATHNVYSGALMQPTSSTKHLCLTPNFEISSMSSKAEMPRSIGACWTSVAQHVTTPIMAGVSDYLMEHMPPVLTKVITAHAAAPQNGY